MWIEAHSLRLQGFPLILILSVVSV
ncbi:uncharacterized protein METZ01_LOCUS231111, partial [marine metagenome]